MKERKRRKSCPECRSRDIARVKHIVENDFRGVTVINEDCKDTLVEPGPVYIFLPWKKVGKLALWFSLFFTPFAGPLMALAVKILYDGKIDEEASVQTHKEWARQGFCYSCGSTWDNPI
jgi:hypothetical protein